MRLNFGCTRESYLTEALDSDGEEPFAKEDKKKPVSHYERNRFLFVPDWGLFGGFYLGRLQTFGSPFQLKIQLVGLPSKHGIRPSQSRKNVQRHLLPLHGR